jgi:hypothetical protein
LGKITLEKLTRANVDENDPEEWARYREQLLDRAEGRIKTAVKELQEFGIMDENGHPVKKELPPDRKPRSKTDV